MPSASIPRLLSRSVADSGGTLGPDRCFGSGCGRRHDREAGQTATRRALLVHPFSAPAARWGWRGRHWHGRRRPMRRTFCAPIATSDRSPWTLPRPRGGDHPELARARRCARELQGRRSSGLRPGLLVAERRQSAARLLLDHRVRPDGALRCACRIRFPDPGHGRADVHYGPRRWGARLRTAEGGRGRRPTSSPVCTPRSASWRRSIVANAPARDSTSMCPCSMSRWHASRTRRSNYLVSGRRRSAGECSPEHRALPGFSDNDGYMSSQWATMRQFARLCAAARLAASRSDPVPRQRAAGRASERR